MQNNFEGFGLSQMLLKSLAKMDYTAPTPIQAKAIPLALDGRDILGSAQTGTGKTAAFGIPVVEKIMNSDRGAALILTPTRELAKQVLDVITQLVGRESKINTAFLIGGASMEKQMNELRRNPRIIVGTPGRINDHLERGTMKLHDTNFLVLDETDRMLDMGFGVQIDRILKFMPKKKQTLMFSATMPKEIVQMSARYLSNPERIKMGATNVVATKIKQEIIRIDQGAKYKELVNQLYDRNGSVIIFVKTKYGTERMAKNLNRDGFEADALHGDLRQRNRDKVMQRFRDKKFRILVATDIAARGLDVPHIEHVINHDLPQVAEDYIHRMGRTARAGAEGSALCFISPQEAGKWSAIERLLDPNKKSDGGGQKSGKKGKPRRSGKFGGGGKPEFKKGGYKQSRSRRDNAGANEDKRDDQKRSFKKPYKKEGQKNEERFDAEKRQDGDKPRSKKPYKKYVSKADRAEGGSGNKSFGKSGDKPASRKTASKKSGKKSDKKFGAKSGKASFSKGPKGKKNTSAKPGVKGGHKQRNNHRNGKAA